MQQYPDGISSGSIYLTIDDLWEIFEFLDHLPDEDTASVFRAVPKLRDRFGFDRMTNHDLWQFWDHTRDVGTTEYRVAIVLMTYAA